MFHVFGAEFCRAPCRGRGSPLVGRQGQRDDCIPGHPQHTRLLPIRYWRNNPLDTELPDKQPPPFNETQGCSWLVQKTGWRGTL